MTIAPLAKSYTADAFTTYVAKEVEPKMGVWRPRGFVLHNTGLMTPKGEPLPAKGGKSTSEWFYLYKGKPLAGLQRVKNMWVSYQDQGWAGGPHLVVTDREIFTGNPLWLRGTHSPSWNAMFWGLEMAGDFDVEAFPPALRDLAVHAMATLYAMLGAAPTNDTFHLHKEDPATTHKHCPGKNAGVKADWIKAITAHMATLHPGGCLCGDHAKALVA